MLRPRELEGRCYMFEQAPGSLLHGPPRPPSVTCSSRGNAAAEGKYRQERFSWLEAASAYRRHCLPDNSCLTQFCSVAVTALLFSIGCETSWYFMETLISNSDLDFFVFRASFWMLFQ